MAHPTKGSLGWETVAAHKAWQKSPVFATSLKNFKRYSVPSSLKYVHAYFVDSPVAALQAPVTEVAWFTLKAGASKEDAEKVFTELTQVWAGEAEKENKRCHGGTWGPVVEKPGVYAVVIGYPSIEVHSLLSPLV